MSTQQKHRVRRMRTKTRLWITIAAGLLALLTVVLCVMSGAFNFHKEGSNLMPDLVGQTEEAAKEAIEKLDANAIISYEHSSETEGTVISQAVAKGPHITHNQSISLVVSLGTDQEEDTTANKIAIPSFVGLTLAKASETAANLGVTVVSSGTAYDDNVPEGSIARQYPAGGSMVDPGTTISVTISAGPEKKTYAVTVTCGSGGSVSPSGKVEVKEGGTASFTIMPNDGYEVDKLIIDGLEVLPLESYTFMNVDSDHTLYVTFRETGGSFFRPDE